MMNDVTQVLEFAVAVIAILGGVRLMVARPLEARIDGLEKRLDDRIDGLERRLDDRIDGLERRLDGRIDGLEKRFDDRFKTLEGDMTIIKTRLIGDSAA